MKYPCIIYAPTAMINHMDITSVSHNVPYEQNILNRWKTLQALWLKLIYSMLNDIICLSAFHFAKKFENNGIKEASENP